MKLLELDTSYNLQITAEAIALGPFKKIWDRDKSKTKDRAKNELAYIYYLCDYKSPYFNTSNLEERHEEIKKAIFASTWEPDNVITEAVDFYRERQRTFSLVLLEDAIGAMARLSSYIRTINFDENEINGKTGEVRPKHDIKKFADTMKGIPATLKALKELEETVRKEQEQNNDLRGNRKKGMYAD
jgi:hypothetical protein